MDQHKVGDSGTHHVRGAGNASAGRPAHGDRRQEDDPTWWWNVASDPLTPYVERLLDAGWFPIPQIGLGYIEPGLMRLTEDQIFVDVVVLSEFGDATIVRARASWSPATPRRHGEEIWRHRVPADVAAEWLLTDPRDDSALTEWRRQHTGRTHP